MRVRIARKRSVPRQSKSTTQEGTSFLNSHSVNWREGAKPMRQLSTSYMVQNSFKNKLPKIYLFSFAGTVPCTPRMHWPATSPRSLESNRQAEAGMVTVKLFEASPIVKMIGIYLNLEHCFVLKHVYSLQLSISSGASLTKRFTNFLNSSRGMLRYGMFMLSSATLPVPFTKNESESRVASNICTAKQFLLAMESHQICFQELIKSVLQPPNLIWLVEM